MPRIFEPDPYYLLARKAGLLRPGKTNRLLRAALVVAIAWLPLLALSLIQPSGMQRFVGEVSVHVRLLVALPMLVLAEDLCARVLNSIVGDFRNSGLVAPTDLPRFDEARSVAIRRIGATTTAAAIVVGAVLVTMLFAALRAGNLPERFAAPSNLVGAAATWRDLVSYPICNILILAWLVRVMVWAAFLKRVSRLRLRYVPSHPDHAGGIMFVGRSAAAFAGVAFALGSVSAGQLAQSIMRGVPASMLHAYAVGIYCAVLLCIFAAPLLVFMPGLMRARRKAVARFGRLGMELGQDFQNRWLTKRPPVDEHTLDSPQFSTMADFGLVAQTAMSMRIVPIDLVSLAILAVGVLLPFVPVLLMSLPLEVILSALRGMLP